MMEGSRDDTPWFYIHALECGIRHIGINTFSSRGCLPTPQCRNMSPEPKPVAVMSNTIQPPCKMRKMARYLRGQCSIHLTPMSVSKTETQSHGIFRSKSSSAAIVRI